jgi:biopolymer transport protein ExbD/biopolymer transport protein TolR
MAVELNAGGKKLRVKPAMNVTPLVDVVLVLLIIFMVITPMMVKQFWLHVPKKETAAPPPDEAPDDPSNVPIVLTVRADGSIWINKDRVELAELPDRLQRIFAVRTIALLFFDAEDGVPYGDAMRVLDTARAGGAANIAVLTETVLP